MSFTKNLAKGFLVHGGYYRARLALDRKRRPGRRLLILVYHNLCDPRTLDRTTGPLLNIRPLLTRDTFERHLQVLRRSWKVVSLEEGARRLSETPDDDDISVAITFDDGYTSFETVAFPLLHEYGYKATVFLPTGYVDERKPFWWDELTCVISRWNPEEVPAERVAEAAGLNVSFPLDLSRPWGNPRRSMLHLVERDWAQKEDGVRKQSIEELRALVHSPQGLVPESVFTMTWDCIRALQSQGIRFGAHTVSHVNMAHASDEVLRQEIVTSVRRVTDELDRPAELFAYPYGLDHSAYARAFPVLQRTSIRWARTMCYGFNHAHTHPYLLGRAELGSRDRGSALERDLLLSAMEQASP